MCYEEIKELGFERKSKKTILNNLKAPAPRPLKVPIPLPLPIWHLEDNCCPIECSDKLESRCLVDLNVNVGKMEGMSYVCSHLLRPRTLSQLSQLFFFLVGPF
jgi:hypothetical protein